MISGPEAQAQAQTLRFDVNTGHRLTNERKRAFWVQPSEKVWVTRLGGLIVSLGYKHWEFESERERHSSAETNCFWEGTSLVFLS